MSTAQEIRRRVRAEEQARAKRRERAAVAAGVAVAAVAAARADSAARLERVRARYEAAVDAERQRVAEIEWSAGAALRDALAAGYSDTELCELLGIDVAEARRWVKQIRLVGDAESPGLERARGGMDASSAGEPFGDAEVEPAPEGR
ncbi:hypothetical protein [Labedaea rhizosphaerae]|uniref:hypothetical protein n=1 Tax=Labedaea rhizosphaerae TaxID=598644 RepID=UPI00105DD13C|nr:hypothetical protein [Labedaea rhizosphaerae]